MYMYCQLYSSRKPDVHVLSTCSQQTEMLMEESGTGCESFQSPLVITRLCFMCVHDDTGHVALYLHCCVGIACSVISYTFIGKLS